MIGRSTKIFVDIYEDVRRLGGQVPMSKTPRPTDAELAILRVLWQLGPSTVRQVHDVLMRERPTAYTTALKLMQTARTSITRD